MHLELDTGMSRQGVGAAELDSILENLKQRGSTSPLRIDGLMTHLFAADESDGEVTRAQFAELERLTTRVRQAGFTPTWLNVGNSAAVLSGEGIEILREICNRNEMKAMARPGLAIYGLGPEFAPDEPEAVARLRGELQRVLEWKTEVVSVREIAAGSVVGYNGTFVATEPMRLALLAVGYADGLKRALSNRGWVLVRGEKAPIVGRVSMDQTVVDVTGIATGIAEVAVGDEVVLLGRQAEGDFSQEICVEDHAAWGGTVTWEVFTSIGARVERRAV
jgi:alanine racemase